MKIIKLIMVTTILWSFLFSNVPYAIALLFVWPVVTFFVEAVRTNGFQNFEEVI